MVSPPLLGEMIIETARKSVHVDHWTKLLEAEPVVSAAKAVKSMGYSSTAAFDHAVATLLNLVSRSYVEIFRGPANDATPAIVFSGPAKGNVVGDYLSACIEPKTTAFMATWSTLMTALDSSATKRFSTRREFVDILGFGEWTPKKKLDVPNQLYGDLTALRRYRPDLDTVYGVFIVKDALRLMQHNPCGTLESCSVGLDHVETWVAFVVLLYHCHQSRDIRFAPVVHPDRLDRWSVRTASTIPATFRPFHAGHSPGRVTWLSFEQDPASPERACGVLKVSWQEPSSEINEPYLLELAHKGGWLPGLARHRWAQRLDSRRVSLGGTTRVQEIVHLASIGDPLSQCDSVLHLFKVIFDAIGVHENLMGEGILHCDMSWFNVLCNPRHDPSTEGTPSKPGRPTIDFILTGEPSEPCALVIDLDHGALMSELHSCTHDHRHGTPMFVAVELSSRLPQKAALPSLTLLQRLKAFDGLPEELRNRAFPGDNGEFMKVFAQIDDLEDLRSSRRHEHHEATTDPRSLHYPRHDMESLFWIVLWALLRASPLPELPADEQSDTSLRAAADTLLFHRLGDDEQLRNTLRRSPPIAGLHQLLGEFGGLLNDMAAYIRIPWHLYEGKVPGLTPNHAHIAFRRMLLVQIYEIVQKKSVSDVLFNRSMPRIISGLRDWGPVQDDESETKATSRSNTPPVSPDVSPIPVSPRAASQRCLKRPPAEPGLEDADETQPPTKRLRAGPDATTTEEDDAAEKPSFSAKQADADSTTGSPAQAHPSRHIDRLVQTFWADRNLWFGAAGCKPEKALWETLTVSTQRNTAPDAQTDS